MGAESLPVQYGVPKTWRPLGVGICSTALDSLGKVVLDQYRWAVAQSLMTTQSWVEELVLAAPDQLQPLFERCVEHVNREANAAGAPNAAPECVAKLEVKRGEISNDITLSLRASYAERKRSLVRNLLSIVKMHDNAQPSSPTLLPSGEGRFEAQMNCQPFMRGSIGKEVHRARARCLVLPAATI